MSALYSVYSSGPKIGPWCTPYSAGHGLQGRQTEFRHRVMSVSTGVACHGSCMLSRDGTDSKSSSWSWLRWTFDRKTISSFHQYLIEDSVLITSHSLFPHKVQACTGKCEVLTDVCMFVAGCHQHKLVSDGMWRNYLLDIFCMCWELLWSNHWTLWYTTVKLDEVTQSL